MQFEIGHLFHVYNRSNAQRKIFYNYDNYIFFLRKIRKQLHPYSKILAYCLMPTHFHLLMFINSTEILLPGDLRTAKPKSRTLNQEVGIMLRSYTDALQKQENFTGSLFQQHSKATNLTKPEEITPAYFNTAFGTKINILPPEEQYPQVCFNYIHDNPVEANLVSKPEDWQFSSARDYLGLRKGTLVDKELAKYFGLKYR